MDAEEEKRLGMARVDAAADKRWKEEMALCVKEVASVNQTFTSDDVFDYAKIAGVESVTHDLRAFGPIMMRAARKGICVKENCAPRPSKRASLHASPRSVWRSLICENNALAA